MIETTVHNCSASVNNGRKVSQPIDLNDNDETLGKLYGKYLF